MTLAFHRTLIALAAAVGEAIPPTELRICGPGKTETTKGPYLFDAEAAKLVMAAYEEQGTEIPFDYEHAMLSEDVSPHDRKAAGWFKLEVRETAEGPELWAIDIRWTAAAEAGIKAREWRYISPAFYLDQETRRVTEVINCAVTNLPATKQIEPLAASRRPIDRRTITALSLSFQQIASLLQEAIRERTPPESYSYVVDVFDDVVVFERDGALYRVGYSLTDNIPTLIGDEVEVRRAYEPVGSTTDVVAATRHEKPPPAAEGQKPMKLILAALGLKEDAGEAEALVALSREQNLAREILTLTSAKNLSEALGIAANWRDSHGKVTELGTTIATLKASQRKLEVEKLVDEKILAELLEPARRDFAVKLGCDHPESFDAYMAGCTSKVLNLSGGKQKPKPPGATKASKLSDDERKIIRLSGLTEEAYIAAQDPALRPGGNVVTDDDNEDTDHASEKAS